MSNYFKASKIKLHPITTPNSGFRPGQLGALHSALAHFSLYDEPSTLCLPTGYGKTVIMMALPFLLEVKRVLIVEPSDILRKQVLGHVKELSTIRRISVIGDNTKKPKSIGVKGRPTEEAHWQKMKPYDFVVSTPHSTSPHVTPNPPTDLFDLIIIDEAHHAPAKMWDAYLNHFKEAKFVFLTATPYRRDKKPIPGRLSYYYPVLRASQENAFGKVSFTAAPVTNENDDAEIDESIAKTAVEQLVKDKTGGFDHRIFARAGSIKAAHDLVDIYTQLGAKVASINSNISKVYQDRIERKLINGELDGIVCVDMFGEGYDFPKLKIAALHAPHQSLVPTLQFVGRFARTTDDSTGDATLVAPITRLKDASRHLFQEGVNIANLIDASAQRQISDIEEEYQILEILKLKKQNDSDYESVSPLLLKLYAHARIFQCDSKPDYSQFTATIGKGLNIVKQWVSDNELISLLLTVDTSPPNWASSDNLTNIRHDAFLMAYNEVTKLTFIGSTRRTDRLYLDIMQTICEDQHRPISYELTRRAIAGLSSLRFYNVGLKNTALNTQGESYRVLTGPHAERAIAPGDARAFVQGHFFGSGFTDEIMETVGASSSSRIWSNKRLTILEYLEWITVLNNRLYGKVPLEPSQLDIIQHSKKLDRIPDVIIASSWNKTAFRSQPRVKHRQMNSETWVYCLLTDLEMSNYSRTNDQTLSFSVGSDEFKEEFRFSISGGPLIEKIGNNHEIEINSGGDEWERIDFWLSMKPPVFYSANKALFQGVNIMRPPALTIGSLGEKDTSVIDWNECAIGVEFDSEKANGQKTIHQFIQQYLSKQNGVEALVYDHRSGEAADFIAFKSVNSDTYNISLYHCKSAGGQPSGGRISDVYEVAGQMVKSVSYCDAAVLHDHIHHRIQEEKHEHPSEILIGDWEAIHKILTETLPNKLVFEIFGVQPGISQEQIDEHLGDLMAYSLEYVYRGGASTASWIINK